MDKIVKENIKKLNDPNTPKPKTAQEARDRFDLRKKQ